MKKLLSLVLVSFGLLFSASITGDSSHYQQWNDDNYAGEGYQEENPYLTEGCYGYGEKQYDSYDGVTGNYPNSSDQQDYSNQEFCCGEPQEHPCGDTFQLYCKYEPCFFNEWKTITEPKCYEKKCCRYVAKEYEKICVKYVPQYYTQTCCRYEPEYFTTTEVRNCSRKVCERKCKWVPKYYYKHVCQQPVPCETICSPPCEM